MNQAKKKNCQKIQIFPPTPPQQEVAIRGLTVAAPATSPRTVTTRCSQRSPVCPQGVGGDPAPPGLHMLSSPGLWAPLRRWCSSAGRRPHSGWLLSDQCRSRSGGCHLRPIKWMIKNPASVSRVPSPPPQTSESNPWPRTGCLTRRFANPIV